MDAKRTLLASEDGPTLARPGISLAQKRWRRFLRHKLAIFGLFVLILLVLSAVLAPLLSHYSYEQINLDDRLQAPSLNHWLGTDGTGRDIWSRLLMGGRVSMAVGFVAVAISSVIGITLGGIAGFFGGMVDLIIMRFTDMVMCFPSLIIAIILVSVLGPSAYNIMLAIGLLEWVGIARIVRGSFLSLRETEFVQAAHCIGVRPTRIILRHLLPNALGPILVAATLGVASAILMEAGLSFLGLGVQPPMPSWGNMLNQAQNLTMVKGTPWLWIPPGLAIIFSVLSINFLGDGLRDALDPRQRL